MIERVLKTIRGRAFVFEGKEIYFTFSAGLADSSEFRRDAFSVRGAIDLADKRLYQAKAEGRDRCIGPAKGNIPANAS
jgi:PleD family two-component response regulator